MRALRKLDNNKPWWLTQLPQVYHYRLAKTDRVHPLEQLLLKENSGHASTWTWIATLTESWHLSWALTKQIGRFILVTTISASTRTYLLNLGFTLTLTPAFTVHETRHGARGMRGTTTFTPRPDQRDSPAARPIHRGIRIRSIVWSLPLALRVDPNQRRRHDLTSSR